jgi:hypothetical protein
MIFQNSSLPHGVNTSKRSRDPNQRGAKKRKKEKEKKKSLRARRE